MSESRHPHSERRLRLGLERLGLDVGLTGPLMRYLAELEKWNATYTLSGIKIVDEMVLRHLLDHRREGRRLCHFPRRQAPGLCGIR